MSCVKNRFSLLIRDFLIKQTFIFKSYQDYNRIQIPNYSVVVKVSLVTVIYRETYPFSFHFILIFLYAYKTSYYILAILN